MKNIRQEAFVWLQVVLIAGLWTVIVLLTSSRTQLGWEAIKAIPDVVTAYAVIVLVFVKWGWRWRLFAKWLVPFPDLQGTWVGTIRSTFSADSTAQTVSAIRATLVIRQTFASITCVLYTSESESHSTAAALTESEEGGVVRLSYMYLNRPRVTVRDRSAIHDGSALLTLARSSVNSLVGEYWTSRKTTGELEFSFHSRALSEAHIADMSGPAAAAG